MESLGPSELSVLLIFGLLIGGVVIIQILYLNTLYKLMKKIDPENRIMEPGLVFLTMIPAFGMVWRFIMVSRVTDSLGNELRSRGMHNEDPSPGKTQGQWYCGLYLGAFLIPFAGLVGRILWIMFWVKMNDFSKRLGNSQAEIETLDERRYMK